MKKHRRAQSASRGRTVAATASAREVRVSACLIVKDEEQNLPRCLASLARAGIDEVIVVDTGSRDGTVGLAQASGALVFHFPWCDDFSAARNESLAHASGDWAIWIDADEELIERQPGELKRKCAAAATDLGFLLTVHCPMDETGTNETVADQWRIFRNHQDIRFQGRVHEQLSSPTGASAGALLDGVAIRHYGYIPSGDLVQRKGERNRRLMERDLAEQPDLPWNHFHLGRQYAWEGRFDLALPVLERCLDLWFAQGQPASGYTHSMFSTAALAASKLEQYDRVVSIHERAPADVHSCELAYITGVALAKLGRRDEAMRLLEQAVNDASLRKRTGIDPATATWRPLMAMASLFEQQGDFRRAYATLQRAIVYVPGDADMLAGLATFAGQIDRPQEGLQWARQLLEKAEATHGRHAVDLINIYSCWLGALEKRGRPVRLSVCMIVKNEADNLPRILGSLRNVADEVIVVDTGSTDNTVDVASALGASVHHFQWCDDFSAARNESLRHATGDWILWVDGDDELVEQEPGALKLHLQNAHPGTVGFWLECHSLINADGQTGSIMKQWRIFRNGLGIRFQGRIHESPSFPNSTSSAGVAPQEAAFVRHWGYVPREGLVEQKSERNFRLLWRAVEEDPENAYHHYNLGMQFIWQGDPAEALKHLERAITLWRKAGEPATPYATPMFALATHAAVNSGSYEKALEIEEHVPAMAMSSEVLCEAAIACIRLQKVSEAEQRLERAWTDPSVRQGMGRDPSTATWKPLLLLADLHLQMGQRTRAYEFAKKAMELLPRKPEILLEWAALANRCGEQDEAERWLRELLESDFDSHKPQARRQLLDLAISARNGTLALEALSGPVAGLSDLEALQLGKLALEWALERAARGNISPQPPSPDHRAPSDEPENRPLLSACLIVKDEETNLPRCLASLEGTVDEIVVIDTGSKDNTKSIAMAKGARLSSLPWKDDFSAARNESIRLAKGRFILWIDADEELVESEPGALRRLCSELPSDADGYWVNCNNAGSEQGDIRTRARQWRVFRNDIGVKFEGRIHEQSVLPGRRPPVLAKQDAVSIQHWGYVPRLEIMLKKSRRNHRLLNLAIADEPDNPQRHFNLALQHSAEGNFQEALRIMLRAIELWNETRPVAGWVPSMFAIAALAAVRLMEDDQALQIEAQTPPACVTADLLCYIAPVYWRRGLFSEAIERLTRATSDASIVPLQLHDEATSTWLPHLLLAQIHEQLGDVSAALEEASLALRFSPDNADVRAVTQRLQGKLAALPRDTVSA